MAITSTKPIEGLDELKKAMASLPAKLQKKVIEGATRDGASEVAKLYKRNLPSNYRTLKRATKVIKRRSRGKTETKYTVTPTRGKGAKFDAWYAHIVERGAQPHEINVKTAKALRLVEGYYFKSGSGLRYQTGFAQRIIKHPGVRPTRAMYRAFKQQAAILNAMVAGGKKRFAKLKVK